MPLDLNSIRRAISNSRKSVLDAQGLVLVNTLQGKTGRDIRQILKLLEHTLQEVGIREATFLNSLNIVTVNADKWIKGLLKFSAT